MNIVNHYESIKQGIIAESEKEIAAVRQRVIAEVAPKHQEVEKLKSETINKHYNNFVLNRDEKIKKHNAELVEMQKDYEMKRANIEANAVIQKDEILKSALQTATFSITNKRDMAIADIDALIEKYRKME